MLILFKCEIYAEPRQTSKMELFYENNKRLKAVGILWKISLTRKVSLFLLKLSVLSVFIFIFPFHTLSV